MKKVFVIIVCLLVGFAALSHASKIFTPPANISVTRQKAANGDAVAQYNLGIAYENGMGVAVDYEAAYFWLSLAERSRRFESRYVGENPLDTAAQHLSERQIADVQRRIAEWRPAAASRGLLYR